MIPYNDYPNYKPPFDRRSTSPLAKPYWNNAPRTTTSPVCSTQVSPPRSRELTDELTKRFAMKQNPKSCGIRTPSVEMVKRKFEGEGAKLEENSDDSDNNAPKPEQIINSSLEETYWAQWKPTNSSQESSHWIDFKPSSSTVRGRSQFTYSIVNGPNQGSVNVVDQKSLKILRKPLDFIESNSSEGDKNIQGKMYLYDEQLNNCNSAGAYDQEIPMFTMSMPNYRTIFYTGPDEHRYQERVKATNKRTETKNRREETSYKNKEPENVEDSTSNKSKRRFADKKRTKSLDKKPDSSKYKGSHEPMSKSEQEMIELPKNRVRFCAKKRYVDSTEETETFCTTRESNRSIEGYHGDVDTESYQQIGDRKTSGEFDESYEEEGQGDLETESYENRDYRDDDHEETDEYDYQYNCYNKNYGYNNYQYVPTEEETYNSTSDGYRNYQRKFSVCRFEQKPCFPNNKYSSRDESSYSGCNNRESTYSSTSRSELAGILKNREPCKSPCRQPKYGCPPRTDVLREKGCGTPTPYPKTTGYCNTDMKVCINRSCETIEKITREKLIGDDYPCCLKVIEEKPETLTDPPETTSSSSSQSMCKCCVNTPCRGNLTTTSAESKSLSPSSKDTIAMAVDTSRDVIPAADSLTTDENKVSNENEQNKNSNSTNDKTLSSSARSYEESGNKTKSTEKTTETDPEKVEYDHDEKEPLDEVPPEAPKPQITPVVKVEVITLPADNEKDPKTKLQPQLQPQPQAQPLSERLPVEEVFQVKYQQQVHAQRPLNISGGKICQNTNAIEKTSPLPQRTPPKTPIVHIPPIEVHYSVTNQQFIANSQHTRESSANRDYRYPNYDENHLAEEIDMEYGLSSTEANGLNSISNEESRDVKLYGQMRGGIMIPSEPRSSAPAVVPKSILLQRAPRRPPCACPSLKGHTYTLKPPTSSSGRAAKTPKGKR